jgi:hypothetical protein
MTCVRTSPALAKIDQPSNASKTIDNVAAAIRLVDIGNLLSSFKKAGRKKTGRFSRSGLFP